MKTIVWHRRDLRIKDNKALCEASKIGSVIPIFVIDPIFFDAKKYSNSRLVFLIESLIDLNNQYKEHGGHLVLLEGDPIERITSLKQRLNSRVFFNFDTSGKYGRDRDNSAIMNGFIGFQNDAIQRAGRQNNWSQNAKNHFESQIQEVESLKLFSINPDISIDEVVKKYSISHDKNTTYKGGSYFAQKRLEEFLSNIKEYPKSISKPYASELYTSRLSTHFSFGTISIRDVYQQTDRICAKQKSFYSTRLFWNQHFTQKLEDNISLYKEAANPIFQKNYNKIYKQNDEYIERWVKGLTGYPLIDASMRSLNETGFINFRMRAMVASFFTYVLKQPWKVGADYMFQNLIDADRAINYSQWQMQSGLVGVHPNRIYNPTKQIIDYDPECRFIRKYVPELKDVSNELIIEDTENRSSTLFGSYYIEPIVSFSEEAKAAREIYSELNKEAFNLVQSDKRLREKLSLSGVAKRRQNNNNLPETKVV